MKHFSHDRCCGKNELLIRNQLVYHGEASIGITVYGLEEIGFATEKEKQKQKEKEGIPYNSTLRTLLNVSV